jgi:hypothetical protein
MAVPVLKILEKNSVAQETALGRVSEEMFVESKHILVSDMVEQAQEFAKQTRNSISKRDSDRRLREGVIQTGVG